MAWTREEVLQFLDGIIQTALNTDYDALNKQQREKPATSGGFRMHTPPDIRILLVQSIDGQVNHPGRIASCIIDYLKKRNILVYGQDSVHLQYPALTPGLAEQLYAERETYVLCNVIGMTMQSEVDKYKKAWEKVQVC